MAGMVEGGMWPAACVRSRRWTRAMARPAFSPRHSIHPPSVLPWRASLLFLAEQAIAIAVRALVHHWEGKLVRWN